MNVTINTDASFNDKLKIGGYAFWITSNKGRIKSSGILKESLNSEDCEKKCIANALYSLYNSSMNDKNISRIYINTDCLGVIKKVERKIISDPIISYILKLIDLILEETSSFETQPIQRYEFRHVKAHTGKLDKPRSYVNDWCDKEAKKKMREEVNNVMKRK